MSKQIKQMEMDALKETFQGVRDLVVLSVSGGVNCQMDNQFRAKLRKKDVRLQIVKNSLTRRILDELGIKVGAASRFWQGPSLVAWAQAAWPN